MTRSAALLRVLTAYVVAFAVAALWLYVGPDTGRLWLDGLIADVLATLVVFGFSRAYRNSSFYDPYWSVLPPLLAIWWWSEGTAGLDEARAWLVVGLITLWAVRLTTNWVETFTGLDHEDWRYTMLKEGRPTAQSVAIDLGGIHLVPTLQVFLGMVPAYVVLTRPGRDVGWLDAIALAVGLMAVTLELAADRQMHRFLRTREPGQVMDRGLWAWTRHPNYLGEITFWLALALFGLGADPSTWWWVFVGAVAMLALFLGVSIPMMERRSLERRPAYRDVVDSVPKLFPRRPRRVA